MFGLQQGTKVLKQIHAEIGGIEQVEKLLGESEEAQAYEREIGDMLAGRMSNQDEDEVEDELEALQKEVVRIEGSDQPELSKVPENGFEGIVTESKPTGVEKTDAGSDAANLRTKQQKARAKVRAQESAERQPIEPMLA